MVLHLDQRLTNCSLQAGHLFLQISSWNVAILIFMQCLWLFYGTTEADWLPQRPRGLQA